MAVFYRQELSELLDSSRLQFTHSRALLVDLSVLPILGRYVGMDQLTNGTVRATSKSVSPF